MSLDVERVRRETPGVRHRVHLNNAGAALMPSLVLDGVVSFLQREAEIGGYEAAYESAVALSAVYDGVAELVHADREEIALMQNATQAWQMAFYAQTFHAGDRILTCRAEYAANYVAFLQVAQRTGAVIEVIPDDADGALDPAALEVMIDDRVRLIAITWVPTNSGLVNPAAEVGRIAREHDILYLLDGCQAVGQMPVDVTAIGCDMFSATGRKFLRGPRGTGFLYVRKEQLLRMEPPMIDHFGAPWVQPERYELRTDARRFETWERSYALSVGLGIAVRYALDIGLEAIQERSRSLADELRVGLSALDGVTVHDPGKRHAAIVSFTVASMDAREVNARLFAQGINVSHSMPATTLLDSLARGLPALVRASPHYYNTQHEIETLVAAVDALKGN